MPVTPTYPGVYIEEVPSGVRTITGVATAIAAFVGYFARGPLNEAVRIYSFADFERRFGGLHRDSEAGYSIQQFFVNGGAEAWVVRVAGGAPAASSVALRNAGDTADILTVEAASEGLWGDDLTVTVDYNTKDASSTTLFNLSVAHASTGETEVFRNLVMDSGSSSYAVDVVNGGSELVRLTDPAPTAGATDRPAAAGSALANGDDGDLPGATELVGGASGKTGMYALKDVDLFNILCIPRTFKLGTADAGTVLTAAIAFCEEERSFFVFDPPEDETDNSPDTFATWVGSNVERHKNVAVYFPHVSMTDALNDNRLRAVGAGGTMAGVFARTDSARGVWKAPAGTEATLRGVKSLAYKLTDGENGTLNQLGINCLRNFPVYGNICWGARTLDGADQLASEWKYIPIRRLTLFLEESLYRGTQWVVFEPNDEPLWAQIRLNVGAFMHNLFRQGAFQGTSAKDAYFVKCDGETTTQSDINNGIVNILVGFAPLKPAEFVVIKIQQIAGEIET